MDGWQEITEGNAMFFGMVDAEMNSFIYKNLTAKFINPDTALTHSVWDGLWTKPAIAGRAQSGYLTMTLTGVGTWWLIASATTAFNWQGTPNYDLVEYDRLRAGTNEGDTRPPK